MADSVDATRVTRLCEALTLASEGEFGDARQMLADVPADAFGELERMVRSLVFEFQISIEQNQMSIAEFEVSKQELLSKIETISQQQAEIQTLAAPIIDVDEDVVAVSMTGVSSSARAEDLAERLLQRIADAGTRWVILDVTGVDDLDSHLADRLMRMASAVRLMGAQCLMTGISPSVAQSLVSLGASLDGLRTLASLRDGLRYCREHRSA